MYNTLPISCVFVVLKSMPIEENVFNNSGLNNDGYIDTLSDIYYVRGDVASAVENIRRAIQIDPKNAYYKQQLWKFKNVKPKKVS